MNTRHLLSLSLLLAATAGLAQDSTQSELDLDLLPNQAWWGGTVALGTKMPYGAAPIDINLDGDNRGNQHAPLAEGLQPCSPRPLRAGVGQALRQRLSPRRGG